MAKFTPKTINDIYFEITEQAITTINTSVCFYLRRATKTNLNQIEDTLIDIMPFVELITNCEMGRQLLKETNALLSNVQCYSTASLLNDSAILNLSTKSITNEA